MGSQNTKYLIVIISIIILVMIIGSFWFFSSQEHSVKAQLIIDSGVVKIKEVGGNWINAESGILLKQSDTVLTGDNASASIILFETSIIRLGNNTEILIKELVHIAEEKNIKIQQESGRAWSTLLKISGIDTYEVQTPNTIASVRGTSFYVFVLENGSTNVGVTNGLVNITRLFENQIIDYIDLEEGYSLYIDPRNIQKPLQPYPLEEHEWVEINIESDEEFINEIQGDVFDRISPYIDELKEKFGITEEELEALIEGYLKGYYDLPPETPDWVRDLINGP